MGLNDISEAFGMMSAEGFFFYAFNLRLNDCLSRYTKTHGNKFLNHELNDNPHVGKYPKNTSI